MSTEQKSGEGQAVVPAGPEQRTRVFELFRYARGVDYLWLGGGVLGSAVVGVSFPGMAHFLQKLMLYITIPDDTERGTKIQEIVLIFLVLGAMALLGSYIQMAGFGRAADNQTARIKLHFLRSVLRQNVGWYDTHNPAELSTRTINDSHTYREGVGEKLSLFVSGIFMGIGGFVVAFINSAQLTGVLLSMVPLLVASMSLLIVFVTKFSSVQQKAYAEAGGVAETALGSMRTVLAFGGEDKEGERYAKHLRSAEASGIRAGTVMGFGLGSHMTSFFLMSGLGFWYGAVVIKESIYGTLDLADRTLACNGLPGDSEDCFNGGQVLSCIFGVMIGAMGLGQSAPSIAALGSARAAAKRMFDIIDRTPDIDVASQEGQRLPQLNGEIRCDNIFFRYPNRPEQPVLQGLSLTCNAGETTAMVGQSGCGKSTVMQLLLRFYSVDSGTMYLDGVDLTKLNVAWLRSQIGVVQQEPILFRGTVQENIAHGCEGAASLEDVQKAAKQANAHVFITGFSQGYNTPCGERGTQMSGGQKQRVAIARAMIRRPKILLLDEATSALDSESEHVVQQAIDSLLAQTKLTTLVIAHRLTTIRNANKIVVFSEGKASEEGDHGTLMAIEGGLYRQFVTLQGMKGTEEEEGAAPAEGEAVPAMTAPAARGASNTSTASDNKSGKVVLKEEIPADLVETESDQKYKVNKNRIWTYNKGDMHVLVLGLIGCLGAGASMPGFGWLFAENMNIYFNFPVCTPNGSGTPTCVSQAPQQFADSMEAKATDFALMFVIIGVALFFIFGLQSWAFRVLAERMARRMRADCFRAMLCQEIGWFDATSTGALTERLASEVPLIRAQAGESLGQVLQQLTTVSVALVMAFVASWQLTLVALGCIPVLGATQAFAHKIFLGGGGDQAEATGGTIVTDAVGSIRTVAAFGLEEKMIASYAKVLAEEAPKLSRAAHVQGAALGVSNLVQFLMYALIFGVAHLFIADGIMEASATMQVLFPVLFCGGGLGQAAQWATDRAKASVATYRVFRLLDRVPKIPSHKTTTGSMLSDVRGEIAFEHVKFSYPARPHIIVLHDLSFVVAPKTTAALVGPSGSGKSTVIAMLERFYDPISGCVKLDGVDIKSINVSSLRLNMALVQQEPVLFGGSIFDNIKYGKDTASKAEVEEAAKMANAHDYIAAFPGGYDTACGDRGTQLSGGQKQRIAIARAMIRRPKILLLDEATSALDSESEKIVQEAIDKVLSTSDVTTIVIAHRLSTIQNAHSIHVVSGGRIAESGTHEELMQLVGGHYKQLVNRQENK